MTALGRLLHNLKRTPQRFKESLFRHDAPTSARTRSQAVFSNFFLHIQSTHIHKHSLRPSTTWGLGVITLILFVILCVTGVLLMVYYKPAVADAYDSVKDLSYVVPVGRMMRNVHRWAAHGMVITVLLHMARVFYTGSYFGSRNFNWVIGMVLLVLTLGLSFTGYLLPWDQLAFWAVTIGANIAQSPREVTDALGITTFFDVGGMTKHVLLGADEVGQEALIRFYVLHVIVLPVIALILCGVHFWRIRKDGGLNRPADVDRQLGADTRQGREIFPEGSTRSYGLMAIVRGKTPVVNRGPEHTVPTWPHLLSAEMLLLVLTTAAVLVAGYLIDAPLRELANPSVPENPAKAPWYFLGLQELVSYSAFSGGILIPGIVVVGLMLIPYLDREDKGVGIWFATNEGRRVAWRSAIFAAVFVVAVLAFTVRFGWLRDWFPEVPQWVITIINPGTVYVLGFAWWSIHTTRRTDSTRMGAIGLFTCFIVSFVILTYFAVYHRGPNWDFYWTQAAWPGGHGG
ncbi:MAG: cytochrome b N-terminal domain-containing protein [Planctomycetota bacterium]|jgi:quinol-cytochrome oxidoreductase complex cytochrome b subunit